MANFHHVIRNFSGGLLEDKREQSPVHFSITKHFDTFTYPTKLVPYYQTLASLGSQSLGLTIQQLNIVKFLYAPTTGGLSRLFGYGTNPANGHTKLYTFDIDAGTPNATYWIAATNGESGVAGRDTNAFFYYKSYLYNFTQGTTLQRADATGSGAFNDSYQYITYTNAVQPVRHPSDDIAYFFGDSTVYSLNNTTWNGAVLSLPTTERIVCSTPFGNYLAIGTVTTGSLDVKSTVYLWDRDSSLTTLSDRIDFGAGSLVHLVTLNNKLMGVINYYANNVYALNKGKVVIKIASGSFASTVNTITTDSIAIGFPSTHYLKNGKFYFPISAPLNGDPRLGIWALDETGKLALDFIEPSATSYDGIFATGDIWWIAHSANGSVTHTDGTAAYFSSTPSVWETLIVSTVNVTNRGTIIMNSSTDKKLIGAIVTTEPLKSGQSVTLKYRYDSGLDNGAWITIFTNNQVGSTDHHAINIESSGANFSNYHELQFRIESYGGAVVTGVQYGGETIDDDLF